MKRQNKLPLEGEGCYLMFFLHFDFLVLCFQTVNECYFVDLMRENMTFLNSQKDIGEREKRNFKSALDSQPVNRPYLGDAEEGKRGQRL